jgi:hypothetical protein
VTTLGSVSYLIAESARLMASEPQQGARARIFQFCMDLGLERAFSRGLSEIPAKSALNVPLTCGVSCS